MDNKYNEFIESYLINDKTKSAIMLIGGWGTGKSFYIQNILKPYLNEKKAKSCITVSLYGLNDLREISKAIYIEERTKKLRTTIGKCKLFQKAERKQGVKLLGKTIVKGITSFFNIDLTSNEDDLQKLYESLDLSGKLIILEDLERTNIPIKDVLGYVNNLVEQDDAKVLLVANEKEILKRELIVTGRDKEGKEQKEWKWTVETQEYLKIKEKTISDTIPYVCNLFETTENILSQFKDETIEALIVDKLTTDCDIVKNSETSLLANKFFKENAYMEIVSIANQISDLNFRSLIFACQKTVNMLKLYNKEIDRTFVKHLFMSMVAFSLRLKMNDKLYWDDKEEGYSLGTRKYPLFKFAHDYVKIQNLDISEVKKEEELFLAQKKAEAVQTDARFYLDILYNFYLTTPIRLELAITEIKKHLVENDKGIDVIIYGKLANYLIVSRDVIDNYSIIDDCKEFMRRNLQNNVYDEDKVSNALSFHDSFNFWTKEQENEYKEFIAELKSIVKNKQINNLSFEYKIEQVDSFIQEIVNKRDDYVNQHTFLKRMNMDKLIDIITQCNSQQIYNLRKAIMAVYSFSNINEFFMDDKPSLIQLRDKINNLLSEEKINDKIIKLQLSWFVSNLENVLEKLN